MKLRRSGTAPPAMSSPTSKARDAPQQPPRPPPPPPPEATDEKIEIIRSPTENRHDEGDREEKINEEQRGHEEEKEHEIIPISTNTTVPVHGHHHLHLPHHLPHIPHHIPHIDTRRITRYIDMLLAVDSVPSVHNIFAGFFTWILLAGFVLFPGTFTTISMFESDLGNGKVEKWFFQRIKNAPLLWIAGICTVVGTVGMCALWYRWRRNYVWLLNSIFSPGALNSFAGVISTLVNVYTAQNRVFSVTAKITLIVTAGATVINTALVVIYSWHLAKVQESHEQEFEQPHSENKNNEDEVQGQKKDEIFMEDMKGRDNKTCVEPVLPV